jgi:dolichol-phosphate mannosyltransferase
MSQTSTAAEPAADLSVIVPTYCEAENVPVLFERLKSALAGLRWEMIVVDDDSPDGTADAALAIAASDTRMRCIRRVNRFGLAGAAVEGFLSSSAPLVALIDGDLQHDERILPQMVAALSDEKLNLAIATRVAAAPSAEKGFTPARQKLSDAGSWFFRKVSGLDIADPMSGFFMIRREIVARIAARMSPDGFKPLVDILLAERRGLRIAEIPYVFRKRQAGESKLSPLVGLDFLGLLAHHASGGILPTRFILFALIGGMGLVVHLAILKALITLWGADSFASSQLVATLTAMTSNFLLNNEITYRSTRYRGVNKLGGLALFALLCSVGVIANINIASWMFAYEHVWWVAGFAGALVGVVWNYAVSSSFVWRRRAA